MAKTPRVATAAWRQGFQDTKQAHHRISFFYGVDVVMGAIGSSLGAVVVPQNAHVWEQVLYPVVGGLIGVLVGVVLIFLIFTAVSATRQSITNMVTVAVQNTVAVQSNVAVTLQFPTPVVIVNPKEGVGRLQYLLERGTELEPDLSPTGIQKHNWGQMEYWTQQWLDRVTKHVWLYLPDHASYILNDTDLHLDSQVKKYVGWQMPLAVRRVVFEHRLTKLRQVCAQIPGLRTEDSQASGGE